jgi:hypothetical protein
MTAAAPTASAIGKAIAADYAAATGYFDLFAPPAGHAWTADPSALSWFAGDIGLSTSHGASLFLRRSPSDDHDRHQLHVEIRLFWNRSADKRTLVDRQAILWCQTGSRFYGRNHSLLAGSAAHYRAAQLTRLCSEIADDLVVAMQRYLAEAAAI